jgi:hypothetical protein
MSVPRRLVVQYDDGSTKDIDFNQVDRQTQLALSRLGLCPVPGGRGSSGQYALLRWKDGWQEVIGLSGDSADLLRYYVIQRIEDRGRLSFNVGADYPELCVIKRMPMELHSLLIVGSNGGMKYDLESGVERWEGIFEEGGKKEYIKYDGTSERYPHKAGDASQNLAEIVSSVKDALDKKGLSPQKLLDNDRPRMVEEYDEIARVIGVKGYRSQEDVYGFIDFIVKKLADRGR